MREHVLACDTCFEGVAELVPLKDQAFPELPGYLSRQATSIPNQGTPAWAVSGASKWIRSTVVLTASVVVATGLWMWDSRYHESHNRIVEPKTLRGTTVTPPEPSLLFPSEGANVKNSELRFAWKEIPGVLSYEIRLVDSDGTLVWNARLGSGKDVRPELRLSPAEYFVSVQAMQPDGRFTKGRFVSFRITR